VEQADDAFVDGFCVGILETPSDGRMPAHYCFALAGFLCTYHAAVKMGEWARVAFLQSIAGIARILLDTHERRN